MKMLHKERKENMWKAKEAISGMSDAEIATLVSSGFAVNLELVEQVEGHHAGGYIDKLKSFDAILVTDVVNPQGTFDALKEFIDEERLLSIASLCIARKRINTARQLERVKETGA